MSYMLRLRPNDLLRTKIEACIDQIACDQDEDGYIVNFFGRESQKLLYYWIEAALAHRGATGSDRLLNITWKYVEFVDRVFRVEHFAPFDTPGHEEIELALFARRMFFLRPSGWYGDIVERALYNGMLAGISLDGTLYLQRGNANALKEDERDRICRQIDALGLTPSSASPCVWRTACC